MAIEKKTVRLLILEDSQNEAERIVSLFRNAGHATRVHRVEDADELQQALQNSWDLFIASPNCLDLSAEDALTMLQKAARDASFIQLIETHDSGLVTDALRRGAQGVVPIGEDERLILIAKRELSNLEERRARRDAEITLREVEKRCQLLLESSRDAICYVHDGMHIYANRSYLELFGYEDADDLEGMPIIDLIASENQADFKEFLKLYGTDKGKSDFNFNGIDHSGESFQAAMNLSPAQYDGESCIQVVIRLATNSAELEEKLREASSTDQVTGLFNRHRFLELLDEAADRTVRSGEPATVSYIQVDNHTTLISEIGIVGMDQLLVEITNLLQTNMSKNTQIARFSDDAFAVIYPNQIPEQCEDCLRKLLQLTEAKLFQVRDRTVQTTLSIGVALLSEKTSKASQVLERAHRCAEQISKGNGLKIHNPADDLAAAASRGDILATVQQALDNNKLHLLFQPVISLRGDKDEVYEVFLRLTNANGEELLPANFINEVIKANTGLAEKLDRWVLLTAIKKLTEHRAKGHNTKLFVDLTCASILDQSLLPWLAKLLKASRLPANSLTIQIRESDAVAYLKQVMLLTKGLHQLQCQVALIQFGCALNPFNTLKHLEVDFVKIDGSFAQELNDESQQEAVANIVQQLKELDKPTIMPRVESATVLSMLWQAGVSYIQGYYIQQPAVEMNFDFSSGDE